MTCVGTTQQHHRCGNRISKRDRKRAAEILDQMSQLPLQGDLPVSRLRDLADHVLCKRYHRQPAYSQIAITLRSWRGQIESAQQHALSRANRLAQAQQPHTTSTTLSRNPNSNGLASHVIHQYRNPGTSRDVRTFAPRLTASIQHVQQRQQRSALPNQSGPASDDTAGPSRSQRQPGTQESGRPTTHQPTRRHPEHTATSTVLSRLQSDTSPPASSTVHVNHHAGTSQANTSSHTRIPTTTRSQPSRTGVPRPRRRSITDPCSICLDDIFTAGDAVWCRAQCGQNVHQACFSHEISRCLALYDARYPDGDPVLGANQREIERLTSVRCVLCRAPWKWEWER